MKKEYWKSLESMLQSHGFSRYKMYKPNLSRAWFVCPPAYLDEVSTCLRFVSKPLSKTLTVRLGWSHRSARDFTIEMLKTSWPQGYTWLQDAGVLPTPAYSIFNINSIMDWGYKDMPYEGEAYFKEELALSEVLQQSNWLEMRAADLLELYENDNAPFGWRDDNAAIRLAEMAGILISLGKDVSIFDICAEKYASLIDFDMFKMGSGSDWTAALRKKIIEKS